MFESVGDFVVFISDALDLRLCSSRTRRLSAATWRWLPTRRRRRVLGGSVDLTFVESSSSSISEFLAFPGIHHSFSHSRHPSNVFFLSIFFYPFTSGLVLVRSVKTLFLHFLSSPVSFSSARLSIQHHVALP